jgi:ADP-heptose:LPS heptosyltransferase
METAAPLQEVLENSTLVNGFITLPPGGGGLASAARAIGQIRAFSPDLLVYLSEPSKLAGRLRERVFFALAGVRQTLGAPDSPDTATYRRREGGLWESEADRLCRIIGAGAALDWTFAFTDEERARAANHLDAWPAARKFIVFSQGAKLPDKDWGDANWRHVLGNVSAIDPMVGLVAIGAKEEAARARALMACWRGPTLDLCGVTPPRVSALVAERALFYLGHDSGPMHLAALAGTPCVAVFSARAKPGVWFPRGSANRIFYPWADAETVSDRTGLRTAGHSIAQTQPAEVAAAARELLAARADA